MIEKNTMIAVFMGLAILAVVPSGCGSSHSEQGEDNHSRDEHASGIHDGHDHEQDTEHEEQQVVKLDDTEMLEFGIEVDTARPGKISIRAELPGEIVLNADRLAHIVPRVPGVVREVKKSLGDPVRAGEIMAVIESRELAEAEAVHIAAEMRMELAQAIFEREKGLYQKKISSLQDFLNAKQAMIEARIAWRMAEQKHHALDLTENAHQRNVRGLDSSLARYEIIAPFSGTVIEKHITLGEVLKEDAEAFLVADLSTVWVDLSVYRNNLPYIRKGQAVVISAGRGIPDIEGRIEYIGPLVGEETRTALARVVLPNPEGNWRPGLFITARVNVEDLDVPLMVRKSALQVIHDEASVFVRTAEGFELRHVETGREDETFVEIVAGIAPGQVYVAEGAFTLKAQMAKGSFGHGHVH